MTTYTSPSGYTSDHAILYDIEGTETGGPLDYWSDDDLANDVESVFIQTRTEPYVGSVTATFAPMAVSTGEVVVVGFRIGIGSVG